MMTIQQSARVRSEDPHFFVGAPASRPDASLTPVPVRSGRFALPAPWPLAHGGSLPAPRLAWELVGASDRPVVAVLGGISAGRHLLAHHVDRTPGWWPTVAGPGLALDPRRHRLLSFDYLGGTGDSSGAEGDVAIDSRDQARALDALIEHLGIGRLAAVVGASYGGMVALSFAARFPTRLDRLVVLSAADRAHAQATAWRCLQRRIVRLGLDAADALGDRQQGAGLGDRALSIARGLAMVGYRTPEELHRRFGSGVPVHVPRDGAPRFPVEPYLEHCGARFVERFTARAFLTLSTSIDLHRVDPAQVTTTTTLVAVHPDQVVPAADVRRLAGRLAGPCRLLEIDSLYGHDAFLKEGVTIGRIVASALERPPRTRRATPCSRPAGGC